MEEALTKHFLTTLFDVPVSNIQQRRELLSLSVKYGGVDIPDPTKTCTAHHRESREVTHILSALLHPNSPTFNVVAHTETATASIKEHRLQRGIYGEETLGALIEAAPFAEVRRMWRSTETGTWFTVTPMEWNGTSLEAE